MQPVFSMLAGMVLLGSILLRIVKFRLNLTVLAIALFVYASIGIGLLLSNHADVREFVRFLVSKYTYDLTFDQNIAIAKMVGIIVLIIHVPIALSWASEHGTFEFVKRLWASTAALLLAVLSIMAFWGLIYLNHLIFNSFFGMYVLFIIGMTFLAIVNALLGIIVVGANIAFAIVQYSKGQPIDLFSFLGMVDVVQIDTALVSLLIIGITALVGSLEIFFGY